VCQSDAERGWRADAALGANLVGSSLETVTVGARSWKMPEDRDAEDLINDAMDLLALGYPFEGSAAEKAQWMAVLQADLERRAPRANELLRRVIREV
jgi:hypothetical protein